MPVSTIPWPELFAEHRRYLWSVCYRLTGDVLDAEDLVQATFERAMERPPEDLDRPWRPWLTRVATNLAIDLLRRRSHAAYDGPWLPAPVEDLLEVEGWTREHHGHTQDEPEVRYGQLESARFAFLLALETLDPRARAVLILRDVLGYSGPETAEFLEVTPANVRVILHRARKQIEQARAVSRPAQAEVEVDPRIELAIERMLTALANHDTEALEQLLAEDVRATTDAGGEFVAARKIVKGRKSVMALFTGIGRGAAALWSEFRSINGEPALVASLAATPLRTARQAVFHVELDDAGRICEVQVVLATRKLSAVDFSGPRSQPGAPGVKSHSVH
jgi:RNA polymerase sigma-70 factor (ECF subfamily)